MPANSRWDLIQRLKGKFEVFPIDIKVTCAQVKIQHSDGRGKC
jgi:hypothetical protein